MDDMTKWKIKYWIGVVLLFSYIIGLGTYELRMSPPETGEFHIWGLCDSTSAK